MSRPRIPFGDGLVLTADAHQWVIVREKVRAEGERAGEKYDDPVAYCSKLGGALSRLGEETLRSSDVSTLTGLETLLRDFYARCAAVLDPNARPGQ